MNGVFVGMIIGVGVTVALGLVATPMGVGSSVGCGVVHGGGLGCGSGVSFNATSGNRDSTTLSVGPDRNETANTAITKLRI